MRIAARPLTPEAFAPFGQVLVAEEAVAQRRDFAARLESRRPGARPNLAVIRVAPVSFPVTLREVERHPYSSQTFVPLNGTRYLVAVCPSTPGGEPQTERLLAFVAEGAQAVNFDAGVWHAPRVALGGPGAFIMLRWDDGGPEDTKLQRLPAAVEVDLAGGHCHVWTPPVLQGED